MSRKEYSFSAGATPMKLFKTHNNKKGVYFIFRVPSKPIKISLHTSQENYSDYGAHIKVGTEKKYPLKIDRRIFDREYLLDWARSFEDVLSGSYEPSLDDTRFLIIPSPVIDSLSSSGRKHNFDLRNIVNTEWRVTEARKIPDMLDSYGSTIAAISLDGDNSVLVADRKDGMSILSLNKLQKAMMIDAFDGSLQPNLSKAFQYVQLNYPEVLEQWMPSALGEDLKGLIHDIMQRIDDYNGSV